MKNRKKDKEISEIVYDDILVSQSRVLSTTNMTKGNKFEGSIRSLRLHVSCKGVSS